VPWRCRLSCSLEHAGAGSHSSNLAKARNVVAVAEQLVELTVNDVRPAVPLRTGQEAGLVVLAEVAEPFRTLRIYIGQAEARAIQAGWWGAAPLRPSTWDLFVSALDLLGARMERAVISGAEEQRHFFAELELSQGDRRYSLSCRPSDAIALAVRVPGPVLYATEEVMAEVGELPPGEAGELSQ